MLTRDQENPIEMLLGSLMNEVINEVNGTDLATDIKSKKIEKIESLRKTHVSTMISFNQMIDYINKISGPVSQEDIEKLLQTYVDMAQKFYTQYELTLLEDIESQYKAQRESQRAIERIGILKDPELGLAIPHLEKICSDAVAKYEKLLESYPALLQSAIDRLKDEWHRLGSIAVASQTLDDDKNLIQLLKAVVDVAAHSMGIEAERIVVVPGKEFALYFFKYLENFAVLTVPIYSVTAPWEWSIFWHELAGYKVRRLEKDITLNTIRKKLDDLYGRYNASNEEDRKKILDTVALGGQFSRNYLEKLLSSDKEMDLIDLGSFEHQFERMIAHLPKKNRLQLYQQIKSQGWSVDWFKELFEDAWSILAIGKQFLPFFEDVLKRHDAKDDRHPPMEIRIQVAKEILNITSPYSFAGEDFKSKMPERAAAQQILNFISLLHFAARKIERDAENKTTLKEVHSVANKLELDSDLTSLQKVRDFLFDSIRKVIQDAIEDWSIKYPRADFPVDGAKADAEELISNFSGTVIDIFSLSFKYNEEEKNQIKPSYEEMLKDKKYKELQVLSFFEQDYFNASQINNIRFGKNIKFEKRKPFISITHSVILNNAVERSGGDNDVTFSVGVTTYSTSLINWNASFPETSPYYIC